MRKKISTVVLGVFCFLQFIGIAMAAEDKEDKEDRPTANIAVSALSKYVYNGFELSKDSIVLQPSVTMAYKGFSANVWGNVDTDYYERGTESSNTNSWNETEYTLAYDWTMGPVGMSVGYTYLGYDSFPDTQEVFARAAWDILLTPTLTVHRDYDNLAGWYVTLGVSHNIPITEKIALSLGAQVGYLEANDASSYAKINTSNWTYTDKAYSSFHDGLLSVSLPIKLNEYLSITPVVNYSFPLTKEAADLIEMESFNGGGSGDNNFIFGGVTVSMDF